MDRTLVRVWQKGDVYAPHDLSAAEARKWRKRHAPTMDAFDALSLNPLDLYKVRHHPNPTFVVWQGVLTWGLLELCCHVRIHDGDGTDTTFKVYRLAPGQPAQNCKGDTEGNRSRTDA